MRNCLLGLITAISSFALGGFVAESNVIDTPHKEWIIAPRFLTLQKGITKEEAREWLQNEYLFLCKNHYFPEGGSWSNDIVNGIKKHQHTFDKLFGKYFIQDKYQMEEYLMFASSK